MLYLCYVYAGRFLLNIYRVSVVFESRKVGDLLHGEHINSLKN